MQGPERAPARFSPGSPTSHIYIYIYISYTCHIHIIYIHISCAAAVACLDSNLRCRLEPCKGKPASVGAPVANALLAAGAGGVAEPADAAPTRHIHVDR